jgi:SAM-dependent methyltransferase
VNQKILDFIKRVPIEAGNKVLEVGSMNVNGSPRQVITADVTYIGIDFRGGDGVDLVMNAEELDKKWPNEYFDVVLCCETLEHCENWEKVITAAWNVLRPGGYFCLTTPTIKKGRHNYPSDYWRWTLEDYGRMFNDQYIIKLSEVWHAGIGAIVRKTTDHLDLNVSPAPVA